MERGRQKAKVKTNEPRRKSFGGTSLKKVSRRSSLGKLSGLFRDAWNVLDASSEKATVEDVMDNMEEVVSEMIEGDSALAAKIEEQRQRSAALVDVPDDFTGPRWNPSLTGEEILSVLDTFKSGSVLHASEARSLILHVRDILRESVTHAMQEISIPRGGKVVVIGDIHGQLPDLVTILDKCGLPDNSTSVLFNGDFVDRGPACVEVLLGLYMLKAAYPKNVFFNRGNHEHPRLNERYNFEEQVLEKYDQCVYEAIQESFVELPLCTLIDGKVFVTHAGLSAEEDVSLAEIRELEWRKALPRHRNIEDRNGRIMEGLLWSDPRDGIEEWEKSSRGAGVRWGRQVSRRFMEGNGLELIVRSHEVVDEGFEYRHEGNVLTVFSASNYSGKGLNRAAVALFSHGGDYSNPTIETFYADVWPKDEAMENRALETLQQLHEHIFTNRHALLQSFYRGDPHFSGRIAKEQWCDSVNETLQLPLDWEALFPYLCALDSNGLVDYRSFIERYRLKLDKKLVGAWAKGVLEKVCAKLYEASTSAQAVFDAMDKNGDGVLSYEEFCSAIQELDIGLTDEQVYDLMYTIDKDRDGTISLSEFKAKFKRRSTSTASVDLLALIEELRTMLNDGRARSLKATFLQFDEDGNRSLTYEEFVAGIGKLGTSASQETLRELAKFVDDNNSGRISYREFKAAFSVADVGDSGWQDEVVQRMSEVLYKGRMHLLRTFRLLDTDGSGTLSLKEFELGLNALNVLATNKLTKTQIEQLYRTIDRDGDGEVDYDEFLSCFQVVDTKLDE